MFSVHLQIFCFFDFFDFEVTRVFSLVSMDGVSLTGVGMEEVLAHTCGTNYNLVPVSCRYRFYLHVPPCVVRGELMIVCLTLDLL